MTIIDIVFRTFRHKNKGQSADLKVSIIARSHSILILAENFDGQQSDGCHGDQPGHVIRRPGAGCRSVADYTVAGVVSGCGRAGQGRYNGYAAANGLAVGDVFRATIAACLQAHIRRYEEVICAANWVVVRATHVAGVVANRSANQRPNNE